MFVFTIISDCLMYYFSITDILQAAASAAIAALCDKHRENQDRVKQAGAIM